MPQGLFFTTDLSLFSGHDKPAHKVKMVFKFSLQSEPIDNGVKIQNLPLSVIKEVSLGHATTISNNLTTKL